MKKLMLLAALLAIAVVAAVPAIAQVTQTNEQEADSGDATQNFTVTGGGDFEISPTQNENVQKVCDQQVNQAASATG